MSLGRIAIVDDEESIRRALGRLMTSMGWDVEVYPGGADFLDALTRSTVDCVILDLHMPGMSGFDVLERMAGLDHRVPVITITGHDAPDSEVRVRAGGASAYLRKPVTAKSLTDAIARALGKHGPSSAAGV